MGAWDWLIIGSQAVYLGLLWRKYHYDRDDCLKDGLDLTTVKALEIR
jgi:hypothetical protein